MSQDRLEKGKKIFNQMMGESAETGLSYLENVSEDVSKFVLEYACGDILSRQDKLDLRSREIATIAALTVLGDTKSQLTVHTMAALNVGISAEEIKEIILQMSVYAGFPRCIGALMTVNEALKTIEEKEADDFVLDEAEAA